MALGYSNSGGSGKTAWSDWENQQKQQGVVNAPNPAIGQNAPIAPAGTLERGQPAAPTPAPAPAASPTIAPAGTLNTGASATSGGQQPAAPTTVADSFQQALVKRLNPEAVSSSSASVAPAIQANNLREQRGFERNRGLLAERAAANGQDLSGGFETNLMGLAQDRAGREGSYAGQAVQHANDLQNDNMTSALGQAGNYLSGNASRDLQRYGMDQANALGHGDLDLRGRLGEGGLNLGLLQALLGNDQFGKSLAQNGAQFGAGLDQNGLIALLAGLH